MSLSLVYSNGTIQKNESTSVTITELAVAREYYRFIQVDLDVVKAINTLVACGKGYTRDVEAPEILTMIRAADRQRVMDISDG